MRIGTYYDGVEVHRNDKMIYARFLRPHQVLSTCRAAGGFRDDLGFLLNHQSCEPAGHMHRLAPEVWRDAEGYRRMICDPWDLPAEECAVLGTAANMHNAVFQTESFHELTVLAICTGGVESNAGRAGDPASIYETGEGFEKINKAADPKGPGTINTMLFINKPLTPGALTRTLVTATEAKTAALQELCVNSRYSDGLATGTGTDQIGVAACETGDPALTSAGKHAALGELIGRAVLKATKKTLALQNSLTPAGQCSAKIHLERFGLSRKTMQESICRHLTNGQAALLLDNFTVIERDPVTVAAVAAMVHLKDKFAWGVLPATCWGEVMGAYAAQTACAVSGDYTRMAGYREALAPLHGEYGNPAFTDLVCRALAMGFADKWQNKQGC
ncbi:adenosylcobinamide amidohydrolase [Desulfosalsimonas propionicica]|uniref:Adenosylcobinamide amidohydrolase n=1 Tax=Desulfosalsimonas propionicica TaxID=332175 RepID=A0A7W0CAD8_9BACT|nr:adenosylcobinamide amidohydrolase [Desulfosalsimonas propionicica]MBA2882118.1 adenosylcobinamide amidohydrolase [Desulfosalsimonas propionicica]